MHAQVANGELDMKAAIAASNSAREAKTKAEEDAKVEARAKAKEEAAAKLEQANQAVSCIFVGVSCLYCVYFVLLLMLTSAITVIVCKYVPQHSLRLFVTHFCGYP